MYFTTSPLLDYFQKAGIAYPFVMTDEHGSQRASSDEYTEDDGLLILKKIDYPGAMQRFFPGFTNGVPCTWFTGSLDVVEGFFASLCLESGTPIHTRGAYHMPIVAGKFEDMIRRGPSR